jgi:hypothetical protein
VGVGSVIPAILLVTTLAPAADTTAPAHQPGAASWHVSLDAGVLQIAFEGHPWTGLCT